MRRILIILALSALRMCGMQPCYAQLTAPVPAFTDSSKQGVYLSGAQKVAVANGIDSLRTLASRAAVAIPALDSQLRLARQVIHKSNVEIVSLEKQLEFSVRQIISYEKIIADSKESWFDKRKGEFGFILGLIGGIAILKLLK